MKLKRNIGQGVQGLNIDLGVLEQQQLAEWNGLLKELAHPRIKRITVEFDEKPPDIAKKEFDFDHDAERLDNKLTDLVNPVDGLPKFLDNLIDNVPSPGSVTKGLTDPYEHRGMP